MQTQLNVSIRDSDVSTSYDVGIHRNVAADSKSRTPTLTQYDSFLLGNYQLDHWENVHMIIAIFILPEELFKLPLLLTLKMMNKVSLF